jgi:hypothetical protein
MLHEADKDQLCWQRLAELHDKTTEEIERARLRLSQYIAIATSYFVNRIEGPEPLPDRWRAYKKWTETLTGNDFIISFNYDRVFEELSRRCNKHTDFVKLYGTVPEFNDLKALISENKPVGSILREPQSS